MTEKITKLCDSIIDKAQEFVAVGDFSAVAAAAEALTAMAKCAALHPPVSENSVFPAGTSPPSPAESSGIPPALPDQERIESIIDKRVAELGYAADEEISQRWLTTSQAAQFASVSPDTIRNWCNDGSVFCVPDRNKGRKTWLVCPRSIALRINNEPDPRLT